MKSINTTIQEALVKKHIPSNWNNGEKKYELFEGIFRNRSKKMYVKIYSYEDFEYIVNLLTANETIKNHTLKLFEQIKYPVMIIPQQNNATMLFGHNPISSNLTSYTYKEKIDASNINETYWLDNNWFKTDI